MERIAQRLEQALQPPKSERAAFLAVLTGGQTFTEKERLEPEVLRALAVSPLAKTSWFTRPSLALEGRTPLQALQSGGEVERLVTLARAVGVN